MDTLTVRIPTFLFCTSAIASDVGFTQITLTDDSNRPLNTVIWYPTQDESNTTLIGDNPAFIGTQIIKDAEIQSVLFPWCFITRLPRKLEKPNIRRSNELASRGYIVAGSQSPGNHIF